MNGPIDEWRRKGLADLATARREFGVGSQPNYDAVCFHCQQCIEKLLKGALVARGVDPPRVHDLFHLSKLLRGCGIAWSPSEPELRLLTQFAVVYRYPGETASVDEARDALAACEGLCTALLPLLETE